MEEENKDKYKQSIEDKSVNKEKKDFFENSTFIPEKEQDFEKPLYSEEKENLKEVRLKNEAEKENIKIKDRTEKAKKEEEVLVIQLPIKIDNLKKMSKEKQVEILCKLAFEEGVNYAISIAKKLDNAYVLDKFHDTLVDKLYKELVEKRNL